MGRDRFRLKLLFTAALLLTAGGRALPAEGSGFLFLGLGGTLLGDPGLSTRNPAYAARPHPPDRKGGLRVPLGLLGLLLPERNPLLYQSDRDTFRSRFDFLSFFDQLTALDRFLLNPARSPEEVLFVVSKDLVEVTDGEGQPLVFRNSLGGGGVALGGTPLIPPSLLSIAFQRGRMHLETGLFGGGGGYRLGPDQALEQALETGVLRPDSHYSLSGAVSLEAGLSQSATWTVPVPLPDPRWRLLAGARLLGFYAAAYAESRVAVSTRTNSEGLPGSYSMDSSLFYLYPGKGFGLGARADIGLAFERGDLAGGLGILNLAGISYLSGYERSLQDGEAEGPAAELYGRFNPEVVADLSYRIRTGASLLTLAVDGGYAAGPVVHAGLVWSNKRLMLKAAAGWEGALRLRAGLGFWLGNTALELAVTGHEAPFTGQLVCGLAMSLARRKEVSP